ncbi:filamentous hemagglutinin N-terminal domain-containing protein [Paracoccus marinaquae]|uniref:Filamentous hemagglutinin N-terminal domain-containing protein n=1 Tax=Paracoccus marinaquae TaxID=2841926 RepID=A0ABS6ALP0_9RHOB|nr:filamentous hemagglutinin N-terminal domain-containing protein [Paracoccus marinaquae]MBU3031517.1 filamentous hemagglutinin N-terminal domain-containing protein [Paracoccus marinaquae]
MARTTHASAFPGIFGSDPRLRTRAALLATTLLIAVPGLARAQNLPTGGSVVSGKVSINSPGANLMVIRQGSDRAVVNWNSFSIGNGASVNIRQPGTSSAIMNRVTGDTTSRIHGSLTANGQVYIVNPNGILIGRNGAINTGGGFVASTLDVSNQDFNAGRLTFGGNGRSAPVTNQGSITVGSGGYAALIGGRVNNAGTISAPLGRIGLGAGERVTLDLSGDRFLMVALPSADDGNDSALIENSGRLSADGGRIEMKAATARNAARNAINLSGVAEARSVSMRNGAIVLGGGNGGAVRVSGKVSAAAPRQPRIRTSLNTSERPPRLKGGQIQMTGAEIMLLGALLDVRGDGGGGTVRIGGDFAGKGPMPHARTLSADAGTRILADALTEGRGGRIALWSDRRTGFHGNISARGGGGGGKGGFVEVSSAGDVRYAGLADLRAPKGEWGRLLLDPLNIIISDDEGATVSTSTVEANLATGNWTLDTSAPPFGGAGEAAGNIDVEGDLNWTTATTLALRADNNINVDDTSVIAPNGGLDLGATNSINLLAATVLVNGLTMNAAGINMSGGSVTQTGGTGSVTADVFSMFGGTWTQNNPTLPAFNVRDFRLDSDLYTSTRFLRASGGTGTATDPYLLTDVYGLQGMDSSADIDGGEGPSIPLLASHFALAGDIEASATDQWNRDDSLGGIGGFDPIGVGENEFTGSLDGRGNSIDQLFVGDIRPDGGLFAETENATIRNLDLTGLRISASGNAGGLVVVAEDTTIENVSASGTVSVSGSFGTKVAGGLVGAMQGGSIIDSYSAAAVNVDLGGGDGPAFIFAGGLAGGIDVDGEVSRSFSTGNVTVQSDHPDALNGFVGGFTGFLGGSITDAYSSGNVSFTQSATAPSATGSVSVGGFAGYHDTTPPAPVDTIPPGTGDTGLTMIRTAAHGNVSVVGGSLATRVGGHTGQNYNGNIIDSYADGNVTSSSTAAQDVGGLIGSTGEGEVRNTYARGAVRASGTGATRIGGLIGYNEIPSAGGAPATTVTASFYDRGTSGQAPNGLPGYGQALATGTFQDTAAFFALAGSQGWDFVNVWAPGDSGAHPAIYTIDRVVFARPNDLTLQYGGAETARATGTVAGGPSVYVFAEDGETLATGPVFGRLVFPSRNVGTGQFTLATRSLTSSAGDAYRVVDLPADYEITPAPLTIRANDQGKTYGGNFVFDGDEFTRTRLFYDDRLTSVDLASDGAGSRASVGDSDITVSDAVGTGLSNYDISYVDGTMTVDPASLVITANDQSKAFGDTFAFAGTEFTPSGLMSWDGIDRVALTSDGAPTTAAAGSYAINAADASGSGLANYTITYRPGRMDVATADIDDIPRPIPFPTTELPNPIDKLEFGPGSETIPGTILTTGISTTQTVLTSRRTLQQVDQFAAVLEIAAQGCSQSDTDVSRYLACLSDALDDFANKLDEISTDLPPGMENVAQIVRDARRNIDNARTRAEQRLAGATTAAEREAIRRDAIAEARGAIATASAEIRAAITLVRADDPELASVQTATINRVAQAVDSVGIELSRAVGL